jgi:hypothetical protein
VHTYYAPALVAFYGSPGLSISIGIGHHPYGWVALGWGEPLVPWWGPAHWRREPHWGGWGGPRIVNNVVVNRTTVIDVDHIGGYANAGHRGAIVAVDRRDFGRRDLRDSRLRDYDTRKLRPVHGADFDVKPSAVSMVGSERSGQRPPQADLERKVVATREPRRAAVPALDTRERARGRERGAESLPSATPPAQVVKRERAQTRSTPEERPPFGRQVGEERAEPPRPPRYQDVRRRQAPEPQSEQRVTPPPQSTQREERRGQPSRESSAPAPTPPAQQPTERGNPERGWQRQRGETPTRAPQEQPQQQQQPQQRELPGEPANRVFRGRSSGERHSSEPPAQTQPAPSAQPGQGHGEGGGASQGQGRGEGGGHGSRGSGRGNWNR